MHIVHVISNLGFGGAERLLYDELRLFDHQKMQHSVIYFRPGHYVQAIQALGIPVYYVKGLITRYDPIAYFRLKRLLRKLAPDIIHSSLWSANIVSRMVGAALKIPVMCDMHGRHQHHPWLYNIIDRWTAHQAVCHVAVSSGVKTSFLNEIAGKMGNKEKAQLCQERVVLIKNGIDAPYVVKKAQQVKKNRLALGFNEHDFIIGSIGRLEPIKAYDIMLRAFACFKQMISLNALLHPYRIPKLVIVGGGSQWQALVNLAEALDITNDVLFAGYQENIHGWYPLFDCFTLSSQSEGISIALLEALCFGLPVITTSPEKYHDVIEQGKQGFLVDVGDVEGLAEAYKTLYLNKERGKVMGQAGKLHVEKNFSLETMVSEYEKLYRYYGSKTRNL